MNGEIIPSYNQVGSAALRRLSAASDLLSLSSEREAKANARLKVYPSGRMAVAVCDRAVWTRPGYELRSLDVDPPFLTPEEEYADCEHAGKLMNDGLVKKASVLRSVRRARSMVYDYAMSTPSLAYFVTLTCDPEKIDRYSQTAVISKLSTWARNQTHRHGLTYLLVPELHKDGAIHFHGLINDALTMVPSGVYTGGSLKRPRKARSKKDAASLLRSGAVEVLNLPSWSLGFTTAIPLYGDRENAVKYVLKYIGKSTMTPASCQELPLADVPQSDADDTYTHQQRIGGRYFYSGGDLKLPETFFFTHDLSDIPADAAKCTCDATGDSFYYFDITE